MWRRRGAPRVLPCAPDRHPHVFCRLSVYMYGVHQRAAPEINPTQLLHLAGHFLQFEKVFHGAAQRQVEMRHQNITTLEEVNDALPTTETPTLTEKLLDDED